MLELLTLWESVLQPLRHVFQQEVCHSDHVHKAIAMATYISELLAKRGLGGTGAGSMVTMAPHMLPNVGPSQPHVITGSFPRGVSQLLTIGQQLSGYANVSPHQFYPAPGYTTPPGPGRGAL